MRPFSTRSALEAFVPAVGHTFEGLLIPKLIRTNNCDPLKVYAKKGRLISVIRMLLKPIPSKKGA